MCLLFYIDVTRKWLVIEQADIALITTSFLTHFFLTDRDVWRDFSLKQLFCKITFIRERNAIFRKRLWWYFKTYMKSACTLIPRGKLLIPHGRKESGGETSWEQVKSSYRFLHEAARGNVLLIIEMGVKPLAVFISKRDKMPWGRTS